MFNYWKQYKQNEVKSIDKKSIVIGILQKCHTFSAPELIISNKMIEFLHSNHLIKQVKLVEKNSSKIFNWMIKKIIWNSFNYAINYFYLNFYEKAKIEIVKDILIKLYLKKHIVILIISFI